MDDRDIVIQTQLLRKRFGRVQALDGLSLDVRAGEVLGFLGPNGAGKTTTMRLLMGYLRPTAGSARVHGLDCWRDSPAVHARTGYLPGEVRLWPKMSIRAMAAHLARLRGLDHDSWDCRPGQAAGRRPRPASGRAVQGQPAESRRATGPARRPGPAAARRADQRPGPAGPGRVPCDPAGTRRIRDGGAALLARPVGGGPGRRPGRHHPLRPPAGAGNHGRAAGEGPAHRRGAVRRAASAAGVRRVAGDHRCAARWHAAPLHHAGGRRPADQDPEPLSRPGPELPRSRPGRGLPDPVRGGGAE